MEPLTDEEIQSWRVRLEVHDQAAAGQDWNHEDCCGDFRRIFETVLALRATIEEKDADHDRLESDLDDACNANRRLTNEAIVMRQIAWEARLRERNRGQDLANAQRTIHRQRLALRASRVFEVDSAAKIQRLKAENTELRKQIRCDCGRASSKRCPVCDNDE